MNTAKKLTLGLLRGSGAVADDIGPAYFSLFRPAGASVGVLRGYKNGGTNHYRLLMEIGDGRAVAFSLGESETFTLNGASPTIGYVEDRRTMLSYNDDHANVSFTGAGWSVRSGSTAAYGGFYRRSSTTGDYVEFVTATDCTRVGFYALSGVVSVGIALVSIDGDTTLANHITTAQELVDGGTLDAAALVGGGGTLNPTDRVIDLYGSTSAGYAELYTHRFLATGLTAGAHTVRLTVTGYKRAAATDYRLYFAGGTYGGAAVCTLSTADVAAYYMGPISLASSKWEQAYSYKPDGAGAPEFIGHTGTLLFQSLEITIDGAAIGAMSENQLVAGSIATFSYAAVCKHSAGYPDVGDLTLTYTLDPLVGLTVEHSLIWNTDGEMQTGYPAMLPLTAPTYERGRNVVGGVPGTVVTADADDGSYLLAADSDCAALWDETGNWGAAILIQQTSGMVVDAAPLRLEDRTGGTLNKWYYFCAVADVTPAMEFTGKSTYRVMYFPDGAEAALAT